MNKKMVKCLVCGAVFEAGIEVCPVCKVGSENFIPFAEERIKYKKDTDEKFLILGNGAAAISAAEAVRERNESCPITIVSDETVISYNRPMLTKSLLNELDFAQMEMHPQAWYEEHHILNLLGRKVDSIDPKNKTIVMDGEIKLSFDKCIYALGSECFIPPIPGHDKEEVIAIRRFLDVEKIMKLLPKITHAAIIGGGVLGLEAAWELKQAGCQVTILELANQLMSRQLDEEASDELKQVIEKAGIEVYLGVKIEEIAGARSVTGVLLGDGAVVPAELVLVSAGVRANTAIAEAAGIKVGRAVVVNNRMETSERDIYACGDCAEYNGINYGIWPQAVEMGKIAGMNAAGDDGAYETVTAALTFSGMGTSVFAVGDNGKEPGKEYRVERVKNAAGHCVTYYFSDDCLVGAILFGDTSAMAEVLDWVGNHSHYKDVMKNKCI